MSPVKSIQPLHTLFLDKPPCCLEFVPDQPQLFVVGTYNLIADDGVGGHGEDESQKRDGSLIVCELGDDGM